MHVISLFSTVLSKIFYIKDVYRPQDKKQIAEIIKISPFKGLGIPGIFYYYFFCDGCS